MQALASHQFQSADNFFFECIIGLLSDPTSSYLHSRAKIKICVKTILINYTRNTNLDSHPILILKGARCLGGYERRHNCCKGRQVGLDLTTMTSSAEALLAKTTT
ncbi:hypothetical protein H0G86_010751 [Trichoderma simmonsii]|uniref:Uncharacterized protein n=1 Tax=Trichoderma simmonsii TaxID=1491479 RepID=A0A8G0PKC5_9HYPO|nr:hypothetical protein H0G86_010751 [Trichoderma simmonsii]